MSDELRERIRAQYGEGIPVSGQFRTPGETNGRIGATKPAPGATNQPIRAAIVWPVRLTLPWSTLVSDNDKHRPMLRGQQAIMVIKRPYAEAEERIHALAMSKLAGAQPAAEPLAITAMVWMPDNHVHDLTNSCKLVHDALEGAVYENDRWLHRVLWERAGVDVDAPRAEITITPLLP